MILISRRAISALRLNTLPLATHRTSAKLVPSASATDTRPMTTAA
jgi:hypothetical protein